MQGGLSTIEERRYNNNKEGLLVKEISYWFLV